MIFDRSSYQPKTQGKCQRYIQFCGASRGGYKPAMWNGELNTMFFGRKFQTLNTYKTNNTGEDVSRELKSLYGGLDATVSLLGILAPGAPAIDRQRYLNNNVHAVSVNTLNVLKNDYQLNINGSYLHDRQIFEASSVTTYYLQDSPPLVIPEISSASRKTDQVNLGIELTANTEKMYLKNNLTLEGSRNIDHGQILKAADTVQQDYTVPSGIRVRNVFNLVKPLPSMRFSCSSVTDFSETPSSLKVTPLMYPGSSVQMLQRQEDLFRNLTVEGSLPTIQLACTKQSGLDVFFMGKCQLAAGTNDRQAKPDGGKSRKHECSGFPSKSYLMEQAGSDPFARYNIPFFWQIPVGCGITWLFEF